MPRPRAANIFAFFEPDHQDTFLEALTDSDTRELLANLNPDDRTALLVELPTVTRQLMQLLSPEDLEESRQLLGYPEESVGRLMTPNTSASVLNGLVSMRLNMSASMAAIARSLTFFM